MKRYLSLILMSVALGAAPAAALAQAELAAITDAGDDAADRIALVRENLRVHIDQQHAHTTLSQVYENRTDERLEGRYHLQVGEGARVSGFAYWNGEEKIVGEVFEKQTAAQVYEEVTGLNRDPGLLEREGEGAFSFRLFPIEASERKPVEVQWTQWLRREGQRVSYRVPVGHAQSVVQLAIDDERRITEVKSPTHTLALEGVGTEHVRVRATGRGSAGALELHYRVDGGDWALSAFVHRDAGHDAYLIANLATPPGLAATEIADKDVTLVLDRSGSMSGAPLARAKDAAKAVVARLGDGDRVNVMAFDDGVDALFLRPVPISAERRSQAVEYIDRLSDGGGTDLAGALAEALDAQHPSESEADTGSRPHVILFLTDGQSDSQATLQVARGDAGDARVFTIGVGDGVEKPLLARLASEKRGRFTFIASPSEIERKVSRLYSEIAAPVLVDLAVEVTGGDADVRLSRRYPRSVPDLYRGDELVITGRVRGDGPLTLSLRGERGGEPVAFTRVIDVPAQITRPWVGRMWAQARVDDLLEEIALFGETDELRDEVISLAVAYNFVTQYTSFLAIPESELTDSARDQLADARAQKQQILAAHKDAVALSRSNMPPGDPILKMRAPADAQQVTAYFPFGLVKDLDYDAHTEHWRVRFLVPKGVEDGSYEVKIVIVHADGTVEVARVPYVIDSAEPDFEVVVEELAGGALVRVVTAEPARLVTAAIVGAPAQRVELQDSGDGVHFEAFLPVAPGSYRLRVVVADDARNEADDELPLIISDLH
ncbi:VIT and vWA domain-containing protein [Haliangium ochraceum]|uniref:von Willebrand factor type A n=1 Tax=Haliangium ochraceum (strain DSM 14365 / JCM 11303 / SMP-2) TaxID=502025 RepID=D0LJ27_HALO1|nr:VIT and VWA domain-containing protein [Haliangium ochraceum]ACY14874.1 von Willebrand factor type A [Haliangium ochraceum DSM 14365]